MLLTRLLTMIIATASLYASVSVADVVKEGFFLGVNAGYDTATGKPENNGGDSTNMKNGYTSTVYFGYNFVPFFGLEAGVGYIGGLTVAANDSVKFSGELGRIGISMWGDIARDIAIYNKLGYAVTRMGFDDVEDSKESFNGFYYELGFLFALTDFMAVSASGAYLDTQGNNLSVNHYQGLVGLQFSF